MENDKIVWFKGIIVILIVLSSMWFGALIEKGKNEGNCQRLVLDFVSQESLTKCTGINKISYNKYSYTDITLDNRETIINNSEYINNLKNQK